MNSDLTRTPAKEPPSLALRSRDGSQLYVVKGEMLVGRELECHIRLNSPQISRYHAKLILAPSGLQVEDLGSSNGTFVNGRKIRARTPISIGDQVSFDEVFFRVTTTRSSDAENTQLVKSGQTEFALNEKISLKETHVDVINGIGPAGLKPAPSSDAEKQRALLSVNFNRPRSGIGPAITQKTPEIVDMEEFLRCASEDLRAQRPAKPVEPSPFGLAGRAQSRPKSKSKSEDKLKALVRKQENSERTLRKSSVGEDALRPLARSSNISAARRNDQAARGVGSPERNRLGSTHANIRADLNVGSGPRLIVLTAPIRGKVFPLESTDSVKCWSLGREDRADICIRDKAVSRDHAWITKLKAVYRLRVNEASTGIFVNGKSCTEVNLRHGDRLQFGAMELVFKLDVSAGAANKGLWAKLKNWISGRRIGSSN